MTFPTKKRINNELFIDGKTETLYTQGTDQEMIGGLWRER